MSDTYFTPPESGRPLSNTLRVVMEHDKIQPSILSEPSTLTVCNWKQQFMVVDVHFLLPDSKNQDRPRLARLEFESIGEWTAVDDEDSS